MLYFWSIELNIIGSRVKALRESQQLTQDQLAARCQLVGLQVSRGTLAKIEAQIRCVTDEEVLLLAKALKVGVTELFAGIEV
jgi:transcriptional regulator with XRE-family HTH domain